MAVMMRTMLDVADNSGARKLQMILPLGGGTGLVAHLGDVVTAAVKEAAPDGTAKLGDVVKIEETRPLSKLKRWQLKDVIRRAAQVAAVEETAV